MTREETREAVKVMVAYANGKEIQYLDDNNKWIDTPNPVFDWSRWAYRIKPEPKYRPFKTQEECWEEMHKHPDFGWIVSKGGVEFCHIGDMFTSESNSLMIALSIDERNPYEADKYFLNYTFTDGTPFGIKEE